MHSHICHQNPCIPNWLQQTNILDSSCIVSQSAVQCLDALRVDASQDDAALLGLFSPKGMSYRTAFSPFQPVKDVDQFESDHLKPRNDTSGKMGSAKLDVTLTWLGDNEGTFWFSSQAATCPLVYHTRWRIHTLLFFAEREAGKL